MRSPPRAEGIAARGRDCIVRAGIPQNHCSKQTGEIPLKSDRFFLFFRNCAHPQRFPSNDCPAASPTIPPHLIAHPATAPQSTTMDAVGPLGLTRQLFQLPIFGWRRVSGPHSLFSSSHFMSTCDFGRFDLLSSRLSPSVLSPLSKRMPLGRHPAVTIRRCPRFLAPSHAPRSPAVMRRNAWRVCGYSGWPNSACPRIAAPDGSTPWSSPVQLCPVSGALANWEL